jgi:archaellum component FlaC
MTTKKHKVSAYLTDDEFEVLKGLATQYQVSQSQIVILAIRELAKLGQVELMELPVSYLPNAISGVTKEDMELLVKNEVKTVITELQTNFENQLGEFKSLVFETAPTLDGMKGEIAPLVKRIESLENANRDYPDLNEKINSLETTIKSNSKSGVTKELLETAIADLVTQDQLTERVNELLETVTEGKPEKKTITEIMPSQDSPITLENLIQDVSPVKEDTPIEDKEILNNDEMAKISGYALGKIRDYAKEEKMITLPNGTKYKPIKEGNKQARWEKTKLVVVKLSPVKK